jgi:hypothetical protein
LPEAVPLLRPAQFGNDPLRFPPPPSPPGMVEAEGTVVGAPPAAQERVNADPPDAEDVQVQGRVGIQVFHDIACRIVGDLPIFPAASLKVILSTSTNPITRNRCNCLWLNSIFSTFMGTFSLGHDTKQEYGLTKLRIYFKGKPKLDSIFFAQTFFRIEPTFQVELNFWGC